MRNTALVNRFFEIGIEKDWHKKSAKWGKSGEQSLLAHSLNVVSMTKTIMEVVGNFDEEAYTLAMVAAFLHDVGKARENYQQQVRQNSKPLPHKAAVDSDYTRNLLSKLTIAEEKWDTIIRIAQGDEALEDSNHMAQVLEKPQKHPKLRRITYLADQLAANKSLSEFSKIKSKVEARLSHFDLDLKVHKVAVVRGMLTHFLHRGVEKAFRAAKYTPILYFPNGTVYLSQDGGEKVSQSSIKQHIMEEFNQFFGQEEMAEKLGRRAFGSIVRTHIPVPEFLFFNENTVEAFWEYILSQNFIMDSNIDTSSVQEYLQELEKKTNVDRAVLEERCKEYRGLGYLLILLKDVAEFAMEAEEGRKAFKNAMNKHLNLDNEFFKEFFGQGDRRTISTTTPFDRIAEVVELFLQSNDYEELKRKEKLKKFAQTFMDVTKAIQPYGKKAYAIPIERLTNALINELETPPIGDLREYAKQQFESYNKGREGGYAVCNFCDRPAQMEATSTLVGDGTESFTPWLEAGSRIGNKNKVKICFLCLYGAKLRSLLLDQDPAEVIYIFPQLNIGREFKQRWNRAITHLVQGLESEGISIVGHWRGWANVILEDKMNEQMSEMLDSLRNTAKKRRIKQIRNAIDAEYEKVSDLKDAPWAQEYSFRGYKGLARKIVEREITPPELLWNRIQNRLEKMSGECFYSSPNFISVFLSRKLKSGDEPETAALIRKLFIGAVLSRIFLGAVVFPEFSWDLQYDFTTKGYVKIPQNVGLLSTLEKLGLREWVPLHRIDSVLKRLAALILLEATLKASQSDYGKGTLLELTSRLPGEVLNRYMQKEGSPSLRIVELLKYWEGKGEKK